MINEELLKYTQQELNRQQDNLELIASENIVSDDVLWAAQTILTNKYAEGYPYKRYYGGCEYVDLIESYAINRAKELFNCEYANVQPHSGSQANQAVFNALLEPGDTILGMSLDAGGHLTHGFKINFSGKYFNSINYGLSKKTMLIDYEQVRKLALLHKPKLIICGASSYSRIIDWKKFREIADEVGAYLLADIAHISGLIIAKIHPSPIDYADVVTSTTHKTLRGPRGGLILAKNKNKFEKLLNRGLFPGNQGGPLQHIILAKAIAFDEALLPSYQQYQKQVVKNSKAMANQFIKNGADVITNGTDNHLFSINVKKSFNMTGKEAEDALEKINITLNKNVIPFDDESPFKTSGIRIGTPAITTRGMNEEDCRKIANIISKYLKNINSASIDNETKQQVIELTQKYPIYKNINYL